MPCRRIDLGNGQFAIACSRGQRRQRCAYCHDDGTQLCDHVVGPGSKTCDKPMCRLHAKHVGPDTDLCRSHAPKDGDQ